MKRHFTSYRSHHAAWAISSLAAAALGISCGLLVATTSHAQQSWAQSYGMRSYDRDGAPTTSASQGSGYDVARGIARMPDGGLVVAGQLETPEVYRNVFNPASGGHTNAAVIRYAADGTLLWHQLLRQDNDTTEAVPSHVYTVLTDAQGNIFICGGKGNPNNGAQAPFVAKFNANGGLIWQTGIGPGLPNAVTPTAALTRDGGVLVTMTQGGNGNLDPSLAKLNSDG